MSESDDRPSFRPRFDIKSVDADGNEKLEVLSLAEFAERSKGIEMGRRGFLKLALLAQAAGLAVMAGPKPAFSQQPARGLTSIFGVIVAVDYISDVAVLQEAKTGLHWCMKVIPPKRAGGRPLGHVDRNVKSGDWAVFIGPKSELQNPRPYPVASLGRVSSVSKSAVCARNTVKGAKTCVQTPSPLAAQSLKPGAAAFFHEDFSIASVEDLPVSLRVIHLKTGGLIRCEESWVEDDMIHYRVGQGDVALSLSTVDLSRSFKATIQAEVEEAYARQALAIGRQAEERQRKAAEEARKALESEKEAARPAVTTKGGPRKPEEPPAKGGRQKIQTKARYEEAKEKCGSVTETCSCVPVCY